MIDAHIHMVLDGMDWRTSIERHRDAPAEHLIRAVLERYRKMGFTYLRDGGDRWGVSAATRALAPEYGITYRTPLAPLCKEGHYGGFIGRRFGDLRQYAELVTQTRQTGGDFIKIMISGLMDFDRFGVLTGDGLEAPEIREMIHIAHEEGMAVMAHANGARTVEAAACAGVDSVEHGAYLDEPALRAMAENRVLWAPTLYTIGNLRGRGRFSEDAVRRILSSAMENVSRYAGMGGLLIPGTDAGAWAVPHGTASEYSLLKEVLGNDTQSALEPGIRELLRRF